MDNFRKVDDMIGASRWRNPLGDMLNCFDVVRDCGCGMQRNEHRQKNEHVAKIRRRIILVQ